MPIAVDSNGDPIPEVLFEGFFKTPNGNVVHVRVSGYMTEFAWLLNQFTSTCQSNKNSNKGISYGF